MKKILSSVFFVLLPFMVAKAHPASMYLIGDATASGWSLDEAAQMVTESDGVYEWVGSLSDGSLKFVMQKDFAPSYGPMTNGEPLAFGDMEMALRATYDDSDNAFAVVAGRYALRIDLNGETPVLTVSDGTDMEDKYYVEYPDQMYIIGPAVGGWSWDDNGVQMTAVGDGVFCWEGTLVEGEMKFFIAPDFGADAYGATVAGMEIRPDNEYDIAKLAEEDNKFIAYGGTVTLTVDLQMMKLTVQSGKTGLEETGAAGNPVKTISNGRFVIIKNGKAYDAAGCMVK